MATNSLRPCLLLLPLLAACADDPRPEPDAPPTATVSGIVEMDDAIQNATVFIDFDNDNVLDSYEPRVATDATGHFTLTWEYPDVHSPRSIAAIVAPTSTRVGVTDGSAQIGFELHMLAPLDRDASGEYVGSAVISPLTTLVVSEMAADATLTPAAAEAKIAGALTASQIPFSGSLDVMADFASDVGAGTATSANSRQLRYVAGAIAAIVSASAAKCNAAQSLTDCNDAMFFDPAIVAMDKQLTTIANGTYKFTQLPAAQQADVQLNPGNYRGFFMDTTALSEDIENELLALALDLLADLFDYIKQEFAASLEEALVEMVVDELFELI